MKTFLPADILIPENCDMNKWSVVACDQYTSDRRYWDTVEQICADSKSTLNMIFPEVYLADNGKDERIKKINETMAEYLNSGVFRTLESSFVYVERTLSDGGVRKGIVGMLDIDDYDFSKTSTSLIRATEGTVLERIPPRVAIRKDAPLEIPHIMILIDDEQMSVIEEVGKKKDTLEKVYDFDLMQGGGHIEGRRVCEKDAEDVMNALDRLACNSSPDVKYGIDGAYAPIVFAVGDGNHSLATAKTCCIEHNGTHYALAEIVNLHDPSLKFDAIHRIVLGADENDMMKAMTSYFETISFEFDETDVPDGAHRFEMICKNRKMFVTVKQPECNLPVGTLQTFLDAYIKDRNLEIDYIHGKDVVEKLVNDRNDAVGFILPAMPKSELFKTVILDGALPRKTFSMGHAQDKRFYLECRKTDK